jgi:hypothetical protein
MKATKATKSTKTTSLDISFQMKKISHNCITIDITYEQLSPSIKQENDILEGYSYFMDRIRFYHKAERILLEEAIQKAIDDTLIKGYLTEYLKRKEFITMITKVLTIEEEMKLIRQGESPAYYILIP